MRSRVAGARLPAMAPSRAIFLRGHRADDTADDRVSGPTALRTPIARCDDHRMRHAGIHDVDALGGDAGGYHGIAHGDRNSDKPSDAWTVLNQGVPWRMEYAWSQQTEAIARIHASAPAKWRSERRQRNRLGARVVRVDQIGAPGAHDRSHGSGGKQVPISPHWSVLTRRARRHARGGRAGCRWGQSPVARPQQRAALAPTAVLAVVRPALLKPGINGMTRSVITY